MPSDAEEIAQLKVEVARLGGLVDRLYVRLDGVAPDGTASVDGNVPADVIDALRQGQLILAIKNWRVHTGVGLAEAKSAVEQIQKNLSL
jgi:ribosomal protein L7/L12